jgi:large subunit ribosomal protein L6
MSRIGRQAIPLGPGVKVSVRDGTVEVQGPKGAVTQNLPPGVSAVVEGAVLTVQRTGEGRRHRAMHGLARALLANAVRGVSQGFSKQLEIHGVGYRAELAPQAVTFYLGYTHPIVFPIPEGIKISVDKNTRIEVWGCNRQQVGQVAADIRALRRPDVYKQKGIRYAGEVLRKKAGKTGVK